MASIAVDRTTTPRIGAIHGLRRVGLVVAGIAAFWALWEGYRWFGETVGITWPFTVDATNMPHIHDMLHALTEPLQPGGPPLIQLEWHWALFTAKEAFLGFVIGGARRLRARRAARALGVAAARPAAVHRRVADRADPRGRADGGRRPGDEGRDPVGLGLRDRRLPDLLPRRDEHTARTALAQAARPRADALLRRRPARACSGSCACPPRCRSSSRRSRSRRPRA